MNVDAVLYLLETLGFVSDGRIRTELVRIPTMDSPVLGKTGGKRRALGGRARFSLPGTPIKITVGKRTTYVYRSLSSEKVEGLAHLHTSALTREDIERAIAPYLTTAVK